MADNFTPVPDWYWDIEGITPLGAHLLAHVARREQGNFKACTESAANMAARFHVGEKSIRREVNKLAAGGLLKKTCPKGKSWRLNTSANMTMVKLTAVNMSRGCGQNDHTTPVNLSINPGQFDRQRNNKETIKDIYINRQGGKPPKKQVSPSLKIEEHTEQNNEVIRRLERK